MLSNFKQYYSALEGGYIKRELLREDPDEVEEWVGGIMRIFELSDWNQN